MNPVTATLDSLRLGPTQSHLNLSLVPLLSDEPIPQAYLTLDEALERKLVSITELTQSGSVPELRFDNLTDEQVLLLDGEELVGAKQNRVLNITILVGGFAKIVIPVSCVERGRWHHLSHEFRSARRHMFAKARAAKMNQVSMSLRAGGSRHSNQSEVWASISAKAERMNAHSATEAMADIYESERPRLDGFEKAFRPLANQVGAVFAINGQILGAELFDSDAAFKKLMGKLVGSYAMDAIEEPVGQPETVSPESITAFLERIKDSSSEAFPAIGEGQDLRLSGRGISGGALVADGRVVHLSAFAAEA